VDDRGVIRVGGGRITLDQVVGEHRAGETSEQIAASYDSLNVEDVRSAIAYYLGHRSEVDAYVAERQREGAALKTQIHATQVDSHARLIASRLMSGDVRHPSGDSSE